MTMQTRLKLCALTGILGLLLLGGLGLGVFLPDEVEESIRRVEAERLDTLAASLPDRLREPARAALPLLTRLADDPLLAVEVSSTPNLNLAETLAKREGLSDLWILSEDGTVLSGYPQKERAGLSDKDLARAAARAVERPGEFLVRRVGDASVLHLVAAVRLGGKRLLLALPAVREQQTKELVLMQGLTLQGFGAASDAGSVQTGDSGVSRLVALENGDGLALWHLRVQANALGSRALLERLYKKMALVLLPLGLLFVAALIFLGFPSKEARKD